MSKIDIFFDSSVLIAGIISSQGASRALLLLAEDEKIQITISEQVLVEVERNLARKAPQTLPFARKLILETHIRVVGDPLPNDVSQRLDWVSHPSNVPILLAAQQARVVFFVTLNTRHFNPDLTGTHPSGLRIGTPGDALTWARTQLSHL